MSHALWCCLLSATFAAPRRFRRRTQPMWRGSRWPLKGTYLNGKLTSAVDGWKLRQHLTPISKSWGIYKEERAKRCGPAFRHCCKKKPAELHQSPQRNHQRRRGASCCWFQTQTTTWGLTERRAQHCMEGDIHSCLPWLANTWPPLPLLSPVRDFFHLQET